MDSEEDDANLILTANRRQEILENLRKEREQRKELIAKGENLRISNLDLTPSNRTSLDLESDPIAQVKAVLQAQVMEERILKTPSRSKGQDVGTDHYGLTSGQMRKKPPVIARKPVDLPQSKPSLDLSQPRTDRERPSSATPPRYSHRSRESDVEATRQQVEKDWTFKPSIQSLPTDPKSRKSWDEPRDVRIDRLSRPKTEVIKKREKEKESLEMKQAETCTFQPHITPYDSRRVEEAEPIGKRLHEEAERRTRERETLAAKHEEAELANYTFHPRTHSASKPSVPIYKRLDEVSRKRQDQLARLKQEIEAAETDLTFHPKLNPDSVRMGEARLHSLNVSSASIAEKLNAAAAKSDQKRALLAIEVEAQERDQCTFAPQTRPGKRPISDSFEVRQSQFLERKRLDSTPPPDSEAECTFHPHVLPASERILQAAKQDRSQRLQELSSRDVRKHAAALSRAQQEFTEVHTFEPKIDRVSQRLGRSSSLAELAYNENKKAEKRLQLAAEETAFSFHPSLCSTGHRTPAKSDYSQAVDISFNISQKHSEQQEKFTEYRKLKELDELRECTFTPKTTSNTPRKSPVVIHGLDQFFQQRDRAKKLVAEQQAREAKVFHTEIYKKQPTSLVTTPKPFHLHPSKKEERVAELRKEALQKEMQECRFAPRTHTSYVLRRKLKSEIRSLLALMGECVRQRWTCWMTQVIMIGLLLGAVTGAVASVPYHLSWRETWETLDNWVLDVQPGADSGNHDLEYYTNRTQNVYIETYPDGSRALVIQALAEEYEGYNFTSGKVHSKEMLGPYGFFNVRATVPKGVGLWPAIWLYPMDESPYGGWSANGEIDIMETICPSPPSYATIHYGGAWPNNTQWPWPPENEFPMDVDWSVPHNFGAEWQTEFIQFWLDSEVVEDGSIQGQSFGYIPSSQWFSMDSEGVHYPGNAPFNTPFNMILNLAIGGDWTCQTPGCCINIESVMPANMTINFVEVWSLSSQQDMD